MKRDENLTSLLRQAFVLRELNLYLDTHPYDQRAIAEFKKTRDEFMKRRGEYAANGSAWDVTDAVFDREYIWADGPWPWEYDFNEEVDI